MPTRAEMNASTGWEIAEDGPQWSVWRRRSIDDTLYLHDAATGRLVLSRVQGNPVIVVSLLDAGAGERLAGAPAPLVLPIRPRKPPEYRGTWMPGSLSDPRGSLPRGTD